MVVFGTWASLVDLQMEQSMLLLTLWIIGLVESFHQGPGRYLVNAAGCEPAYHSHTEIKTQADVKQCT